MRSAKTFLGVGSAVVLLLVALASGGSGNQANPKPAPVEQVELPTRTAHTVVPAQEAAARGLVISIRPQSELLEELTRATAEAEACREVIDKPLRCLP